MSTPTEILAPTFTPGDRKARSVPDLPFADYQKLPGVNASTLKHGTSLEMLHALTEPQEDAPLTEARAYAFAVGDATHKAILEPHLFDSDTWQKHWVMSPTKGMTTKAALAVAEEHPGLALITAEIVDTARRCRDAVWKHKLAAELLGQPGQSELTVQAWDDDAMCWRKARLDRLPNDPALGIVDIKTTSKGLSHSQMRSSMFAFGYGQQAAYYLDTLAMLERKPRPHFHMIFVTKEPPFLARCVELNSAPIDQSFVERGREIYMERLAMFALAWHESNFEAYENEPLTTLRA